MTQPYGEIMDRQHFVSEKYSQMPEEERAAQFAPFAALCGHKETFAEAKGQEESS